VSGAHRRLRKLHRGFKALNPLGFDFFLHLILTPAAAAAQYFWRRTKRLRRGRIVSEASVACWIAPAATR
jgi:hypothetical protein